MELSNWQRWHFSPKPSKGHGDFVTSFSEPDACPKPKRKLTNSLVIRILSIRHRVTKIELLLHKILVEMQLDKGRSNCIYKWI